MFRVGKVLALFFRGDRGELSMEGGNLGDKRRLCGDWAGVLARLRGRVVCIGWQEVLGSLFSTRFTGEGQMVAL